MRKNTVRIIKERNFKSCLVSFVFRLWPRQPIQIHKCKFQNIICLCYVFMMKIKEEPGVTFLIWFISVYQLKSVTQSCPTLCDPMNRSTLGLPVHHQLPEFTQTHVHRVSDAIQLSQSLSSPFPPAPNPSQHQSLFPWVNSFHEYWTELNYLHLFCLSLHPFSSLATSSLFSVPESISVLSINCTPLQYSCLENPMDGGAW